MARAHLLRDQPPPPSFSKLCVTRPQNSTLQTADSVLNALDTWLPFVSVLPQMLLLAADTSAKKKQIEILRVCRRLQDLHRRAAGAEASKRLPTPEWLCGYEALVVRFTAFARQYEKKRCALQKIVGRARGSGGHNGGDNNNNNNSDDDAIQAFHREVTNLWLRMLQH